MKILIAVLSFAIVSCSTANESIVIEISAGQYDQIEDILTVDELEMPKTIDQAIDILQRSFTLEFQHRLKMLSGYSEIPYDLDKNGIDYGLQAMNYIEDKWGLRTAGCDLCDELSSKLLSPSYYKSIYLLDRLRQKLLGLSDSARISSEAANFYLDRIEPEYSPNECTGELQNVESVYLFWNYEAVRTLWLGDCMTGGDVSVKSYLWGFGWFDLTKSFECEYNPSMLQASFSQRHKDYLNSVCKLMAVDGQFESTQ